MLFFLHSLLGGLVFLHLFLSSGLGGVIFLVYGMASGQQKAALYTRMWYVYG